MAPSSPAAGPIAGRRVIVGEDERVTGQDRVRAYAFYLPQFHPIPENDEWWGRGFTEWTNVASAKPLFPGHYQPHLPGELGFYDLRVAETRLAQADLAREYGIDGFIYYHYWFNGRRVLERPFQEVLESGEPDFPFALCWANENWTRTWDGGPHHVLLPQAHSLEDDRNHMRWLAAAFDDPRYIRVDGKPLFLVYRAAELDDPHKTADVWRDEASKLGVGEIFLCRVESFLPENATPPDQIGFDAAVEWIPEMGNLGVSQQRRFMHRVLRKLNVAPDAYMYNHVFSYDHVVDVMIAEREETSTYVRFPCVTVSWDNSPRRTTHAMIFDGARPEGYARWLRHAVRRSAASRGREPLVFISAWNEWAEGNHLEPDRRWGRAYLEATRAVLQEHGRIQ